MYQDREPEDQKTPWERQLARLIADARKADKVDRERAELMEALVKHPGWHAYMELVNIRIQNFSDSMLSPAGSVDGMVALEYLKGAMSGLIIARDLPAAIIAAKPDLRTAPAAEGED